jgi:hypothetical protein
VDTSPAFDCTGIDAIGFGSAARFGEQRWLLPPDVHGTRSGEPRAMSRESLQPTGVVVSHERATVGLSYGPTADHERPNSAHVNAADA